MMRIKMNTQIENASMPHQNEDESENKHKRVLSTTTVSRETRISTAKRMTFSNQKYNSRYCNKDNKSNKSESEDKHDDHISVRHATGIANQ